MARVLALSSQVVSGHVGLSAILPALLCLGHEVLALPTIILSNPPTRQRASGTRIEPSVLRGMLDVLASNGRLEHTDAVLTGYLPSAAHVAAAKYALDLCSGFGRAPLYLCDPVLGDDPKGLYIEQGAAEAIRDVLVPRADIITPNRFELARLTGHDVSDPDSAAAAARLLAPALTIATSIPLGPAMVATLAITPAATHRQAVPLRTAVPNGVGDLLSALYLAATLESGATIAGALAKVVAQVGQVVADSAGHADLQLTAALAQWHKGPAFAMDGRRT